MKNILPDRFLLAFDYDGAVHLRKVTLVLTNVQKHRYQYDTEVLPMTPARHREIFRRLNEDYARRQDKRLKRR